MKCRVCGYELGNDRSYCPMCGTKVYQQAKISSASNAEIAWNTKDFPKPKQLEDIEMNWGSGFKAFMAQDASEGFVAVEKKAEKPVRQIGVDPFELPSQMKSAPKDAYIPEKKPVEQSAFDPWKMPQQAEPQMPLWYTQNFTATGVMKTGPAYPIAQNTPAPAPAPMPTMQTPDAQQAAAALSAAMPDATIQYVKVDTPKPVYKTDYEAYKPNYDAVPTQAQKSPEKFNTFMAKNAEFQALLDQEYERIHAQHKNDVTIIPQQKTSELFVAETKVKAQDISDFEKSLFGDEPVTEPENENLEETSAAPKVFSYDSDKTDLDLDELISDPLNPNFDINTIEMTIKQLELETEQEEVERQQKLSRLEAMKAAREAYFKFLDEDKTGEVEIPEDATKLDASVIEPTMDDDMKTWPPKNAEGQSEQTETTEDVTKLPDELVGLYSDDEEGEEAEEPKRKHLFGKFLLVLIIVILVLEAGILGLQHFLPDSQITAQATEIQNAVIDALTSLYNKVVGLF